MTGEPSDEIEEVVAKAWRDVLDVSDVGANDNFFDLGADSLTLILIANRICELLKLDIPVHILFDAPTVAEMTAVVRAALKKQHPVESLVPGPGESASRAGNAQTVANPLVRVSREERWSLPLSFAQDRLWFLEQLEPGTATYSYAWVIPLLGEVDETALVAAFDAVVTRHESLRTTFEVVDGQAVQRIHQAPRGLARVEDVSGLDEAAIWRRAQEEAATPFDLKRGPLLRVTLLRRSVQERTLLLAIHHIVSDGWSMDVLTRETGVLYEAFRRGARSPLGELDIQYADFASWQRGYFTDERLGREVGFWKDLLDGAPQALELPTDRPRPPVESHRGAVLSLELANPVSKRLRQLARDHDATMFMVLLTSYAVLLGRHANQKDVVVGTPVANRTRTELEPLIGFFVNTLALRVRFDDDPTFEELLARVKRVSLEAFEHQELPFEKLVEALNPVRDMSRSPLFQAMFTMQNAPRSKLEMGGATMELLPLERATAMFDITLFVTETESGTHLDVEYNTDLFDRSTVERLVEHWQVLLEGICDDPGARCSELPLLSEVEQHKLLVEWNDTGAEYANDRCLHRVFEEQVDRAPDAVAVVFEGEQLTYRHLDARANQLAHHLVSLGIGPGTLVGICAERSLEMVVGLMGILKAGGAYVPLDPDYPPDLLGFMLADAKAPVLLTQEHVARRLPAMASTIVRLDANWTSMTKHPRTRLRRRGTSQDLAYAIYTSGSTGRPKGAMNAHGGVFNRLAWMQDAYGLTAADVVLQKTPFSFDVSVWELFWPLSQGARLVMARPGGQRDSAYLAEVIDGQGVTTLHFVPSMLQAFLEGNDLRSTCRSLQRVICSGEALSSELARRFFESGSRAELHNLYGPTEAAVDVTYWQCKRDWTGSTIPLGRPIANIQLYVVDSRLEAVPIGVAGELCIAGVGLARGYLHRPGLTAERFVPNPFPGGHGTRMYRTGDLARWLPDGDLEFLGRIDHQVKIRGYRIELGEIESHLQGQVGVREAVVLAREDTPGNKRLVAYVTPTEVFAPTAVEMLRERLKEELPEHMVPSAWVLLEHLPLTPNGKVDRKALPAPDVMTQAEEYVAPRNLAEEQLCTLFADVLDSPRVGIHDNFFALGGHSLLILRLLDKLRKLGWEIPIRDVFAAPTVATMAERLRRAVVFEAPPNRIPGGSEVITPQMLSLVELTQESINRILTTVPGGARNVEDIYPLTPWQEGTLFEHLAAREGSILNVQLFHCESRSSVELFLEGLQNVIDRHAIWRTAVLWEGLPLPVQVVYREAKVPVQRLDERLESDERLLRRGVELQHGFDPAQAPMLRVIVARNPGGWRVVFAIHDLVEDITSIRLMLESIRAHMRGKVPASFSSLPFRTYAAYLLSRNHGASEAFWRKQLNGITEPTLPLGFLPGSESTRSEHLHWLEPSLVQGLLKVCLELRISSAAVLHAAFALALGRCSGSSDVLFGTMMFGRSAALEGLERAAGVFLHALPVRLKVSGKTVRASLLEVHALIAELIAHEHVPMTTIQRCSQVRLPTRLFECIVNYRQGARSPPEAQEGGGPGPLPSLGATLERVRVVFWMNVDDFGDRIRVSTVAPGDLGPRFVHYLEQVLLAVTRAPDSALEAVDVLPGAERQKQFVEWNDTESEYPKDACVHELFEAQVARTPEGVALEEGNLRVSYRELDERANRLAHELMARGVGPGVVVGVSLERSVDLVASVLAVLKAGGAYVPLDPSYPSERLSLVCKDSGAQLVVCAARGPLAASAELFVLGEHAPAVAARPASNPRRSQHPDGLFAVIYTSGSTGLPKGVLTTHRSFVNRLHWMWRTVPYRPGEKACHKTALSFVDSISELFGPLLQGVPVALASQEVGQDVSALVDLLGRAQATRIVLVPSLLKVMLAYYPDLGARVPKLWHWTVSGEKLDPQLVSSFRAALADRVLLNLYGSSEVAADVTYEEASARASGSAVRIGKPISNVHVVVVGPDGELLPVGVTGEVLVGGVALARGYHQRADLTAERFVPDAWSGARGGRVYRTGDRARWLPDGTLEYQGRADHQVKVRGMRVELAEVQAVLLEQEAVGDGVVDTRTGADGSPLIVAYVTPKDATAPPTTEALRAHLKAKLPEYMVPSAWVVMDSLPRTPGGKVDRKALPAPDVMAAAAEYVAPRNAQEEVLCGLFADVLGVPRVGIHDNFFDLGGHSLLIMGLVNRIRSTLGVELSVRTVFESPTVARLGSQARGTPREVARIARIARRGDPPLSYAQERLWFLDRLEQGSAAYNIPSARRLLGDVNEGALLRAFDTLVARHESLRTTFESVDGRAVQRIHAPQPGVTRVEDVASWDEVAVQKRVQEEVETPFDLQRGPLLRISLLRRSDRERILLFTMHHIVSDGWSLDVFTRETQALYEALGKDEPNPLRELEIQYADFAIWQRGYLTAERLGRKVAFWKGLLADAPQSLELPTDRPRPPVQSHRGTAMSFDLAAPALTARLQELAGEQDATLFMVLLAAFGVLLGRHAAQKDVVLGVPIANRTRVELEPLIGFFVNTLAFRVRFDDDPTFLELLARVKRMSLDAFEHQDLPFEKLVEAVHPVRDMSRSPLFQVMLVLQNAPRSKLEMGGVVLESLQLKKTSTAFDLTLFVWEAEGRLVARAEYSTDLFDRSTVERLVEHLRVLLEGACRDPGTRCAELPLLTQAEREKLLVEWNGTESEYPEGACVHQLLEAQVARTPEAVALEEGSLRVSYRELDERANRLAHELMARGVGPAVLVGVSLERSVDLVASVLAVLKAGGAYVPLDPSDPSERLSLVCKDSGAKLVVCAARGPLDGSAELFVLGEHAKAIAGRPASNPRRSQHPDGLFAVIYTSGSTGLPKGVLTTHRSFVNRLHWMWRTYPYRAGEKACHKTALSFVDSISELFGPLLQGVPVVLASREVGQDVSALVDLLGRAQVTRIVLVPSLLRVMLSVYPDLGARVPKLWHWTVSGEKLDPPLVSSFRAALADRVLLNLYGSSEVAADVTYEETSARASGAAVRIGKPISNVHVVVVGPDGELLPVGVTGEVLVGGVALARGYHQRADLTAERFVPDEWSGVRGGRMYRTGDRARWLPDGTLEYQGRADHQVKVRGMRVELAEVQAVLLEQEAVGDGVVDTRTGADGSPLIVAYVTPKDATAPPTTEALRAHLKAKLPEYMVPSAWVVMDSLPRTPGGKVDRKALPAPDVMAAAAEYVAPRNAQEEVLCGLFADVLGVPRVGIHDNFFDLGGHSLLIMGLVNRIRSTLGIELSVRAVFESPTVAQLVAGRGLGRMVEWSV